MLKSEIDEALFTESTVKLGQMEIERVNADFENISECLPRSPKMTYKITNYLNIQPKYEELNNHTRTASNGRSNCPNVIFPLKFQNIACRPKKLKNISFKLK